MAAHVLNDRGLPVTLGAEPSPTERKVSADDIIPCAKSNCNRCWGKGFMNVAHPGQVTPSRLVCRCAVKRFLAQNKGKVVMDKQGSLFYKEVESADVQASLR